MRNDKNVHHLHTNSCVGFGSCTGNTHLNPYNFCIRKSKKACLGALEPLVKSQQGLSNRKIVPMLKASGDDPSTLCPDTRRKLRDGTFIWAHARGMRGGQTDDVKGKDRVCLSAEVGQ